MQRKTMIEVYKTTYKLSNECTKADPQKNIKEAAPKAAARYTWLDVMRQ